MNTTMKFCNVCENMMYIQVEDDEHNSVELKYYCKNCNNSTKQKASGMSVPVHEKNFTDDSGSYKYYMTPYIKYDATLPRVSNIKCTNNSCDAKENEVIYIKYDHDNMKYLYFCCHCDHFWKFD